MELKNLLLKKFKFCMEEHKFLKKYSSIFFEYFEQELEFPKFE
jgi:hypothetical protein